MSTPEEEGMDSKELAKLVDFETTHRFDSLMVVRHSDGNAHLLAAIITKLEGMSALEYAKAKLFGPLGINEVFWPRDPQGISMGGYGLNLQPRDMAKIGYLYLRKGVWEGQQLLPPAWIDKVSHATVGMHGESG